jgi:hypothetical protein
MFNEKELVTFQIQAALAALSGLDIKTQFGNTLDAAKYVLDFGQVFIEELQRR